MDYMEATYLGSEQQSEPLELCGYGGAKLCVGIDKIMQKQSQVTLHNAALSVTVLLCYFV